MRSAFVLTVTLTLLAGGAQSGEAQLVSPREVANSFCKLDAAGKQLSSEGRKDLARLFLDARAHTPGAEIVAVKDYVLRDRRGGKDAAQFAIDYRIWGRVDPSLRFTPLQTPYSNQPVTQSETISMVLSDTYFDLGDDGQWRQVKGAPEWRIKTAPREPHISLGVAIGYVRRVSYRSKDPVLKMNAHKTLTELQNLYQSQARSVQFAQPVQQLPAAVLSQFIAMETDGSELIPDGLRQLGVFFVHPGEWRHDKIHIARGYAVKESKFAGSKADVYVEYAALGELDSSLRFTNAAPVGSIVREDFKMVFDNKYSLPISGNVPPKEFVGPSRWRIEDAHPEQWLTVNAAIRYVTKMRDATTDPTVKDNAVKTLAILNRYR